MDFLEELDLLGLLEDLLDLKEIKVLLDPQE
jgi:hypothetical protein